MNVWQDGDEFADFALNKGSCGKGKNRSKSKLLLRQFSLISNVTFFNLHHPSLAVIIGKVSRVSLRQLNEFMLFSCADLYPVQNLEQSWKM